MVDAADGVGKTDDCREVHKQHKGQHRLGERRVQVRSGVRKG